MAPSLNWIFVSSSSSSSTPRLVLRILPKAAFPPAIENGAEATLVPNTLDAGAPNGAKSEITLRDEGDAPGEVEAGEVDLGGVLGRGGGIGA